MFKVMMNGAIDCLSTSHSLDDALAIMMPGLNNPDVSGHISDCETGEVLVILENGELPYLAPDLIVSMLDSIFEEDPEAAIALAMMGMMAGL